MASLLKGIWIYFIILLFVLILGAYFYYRSNRPLISYKDLIKPNPSNQFIQPNPCVFEIIGGIPHALLPDGNIQLNFNCPGGKVSRNYLRLGAVNPPTLKNALEVLSSINNFNLPQNLKFVISGSPITDANTNLKINDVVEVYYE